MQLNNPYQRLIGEYTPPPYEWDFRGALVRLSANDTTATTAINWNTEEYDVGGWHDNVTNNDRFTVPSGFSLVRLIGNIYNAATGFNNLEFRKDGSAFGNGGGIRDQQKALAVGYGRANIFSGPLAAVGGSTYFDLQFGTGSGTTIQAELGSWFAIEALDPDTRFCRLRRSTTFTTTGAVTDTVPFTLEDQDIGGWFDSGVSDTNVVVPSGVSWVIGTWNARLSTSISTTEQIVPGIQLNGTTVVNRDMEGSTRSDTACSVTTGLLQVSPGDTLTALLFTTNAETLQTDSAFSVEEVLGTVKACKAYKSGSGQSISANTDTVLTLEAESFDTDGAHDNVTNNSRITVPSGCSRARVWFGVSIASTTALTRAWVTKNGSRFYGSPDCANDTPGQNFLSGGGAWVDVTPGDYFELNFRANAAVTVNNSILTFLTVQFQ